MRKNPHVLLVIAPYYRHIADELERGAIDALDAAGVSYERVEVPGAFEIPAAVLFASRRETGRRFDGYVALGCVIRGETTHYDYVCEESAHGLQALTLQGLAIGYGILTVENEKQALVRASREKKNKGGEAARACLAMIDLKRHFEGA